MRFVSHCRLILGVFLAVGFGACASTELAGPEAAPGGDPATPDRAGGRSGDRSGDQAGSAFARFARAHGEFYRRSILHPLINLRAASGPNADLEDPSSRTQVTDFALDAILTPPLDRDSFLILGALFEVRRMQFSGTPALADEDLYGLALRVGYGWFLSPDLAVQAFWEPSIYSDLDGPLRSSDYQPGNSVVLATGRYSKDLYYKYGLALNQASDLGFAPVFGGVWHASPRWAVDVLMPLYADVHFRPDSDWDLTAGVRLRANRFHVRAGTEGDLTLFEWIASAAARRRLDANLSLQLEVGSVVSGDYEFTSYQGRNWSSSSDPAWFVQVQLGWEF